LFGTATAAVNTTTGQATFSGLSIDKIGTWVHAHGHGQYGQHDSGRCRHNGFNVTVGAATKLAFSTQPGGASTGGLALGTQPNATLQDAGGNTVIARRRT